MFVERQIVNGSEPCQVENLYKSAMAALSDPPFPWITPVLLLPVDAQAGLVADMLYEIDLQIWHDWQVAGYPNV